jgi:hypothetical protein
MKLLESFNKEILQLLIFHPFRRFSTLNLLNYTFQDFHKNVSDPLMPEGKGPNVYIQKKVLKFSCNLFKLSKTDFIYQAHAKSIMLNENKE